MLFFSVLLFRTQLTLSYPVVGHGGSDGLHAYVHSLDDAVSDTVCFYLCMHKFSRKMISQISDCSTSLFIYLLHHVEIVYQEGCG